MSRTLRRLSLSCVQSALFNRLLSARLREGLWREVLPGDVCLVRASSGPFVSDDPATDTARLQAGEIVSAGPMFGPKMRVAQHDAAQREAAALAAAELTHASFAGFGKLLQGTRRGNTVWPEDLEVAYGTDQYLTLSFTLPAGSYATVLLREFWRGDNLLHTQPGQGGPQQIKQKAFDNDRPEV
jgi:tRNA pseudouridine13 synthase